MGKRKNRERMGKRKDGGGMGKMEMGKEEERGKRHNGWEYVGEENLGRRRMKGGHVKWERVHAGMGYMSIPTHATTPLHV